MTRGLKGLAGLLSLYFHGFTPVEFVRGSDRITQHASGWRVNGSGHLDRAKDALDYLEEAPAETWRQVYCGINLFLVSDRGNVKKHDGTPADTFILNGRCQIKYQIVKFGRLRNREIYRSHLVAMAFLNYQRGDEREIHHINGYRMDDSVANLVVLSREDHAKVHSFGPTAPTGPVEEDMPLPKERARRGRKASRGKHAGAFSGPGFAEPTPVTGVPANDDEGEEPAESAETKRDGAGERTGAAKRRRGKSTAKRRVEQRRAEEQAAAEEGCAQDGVDSAPEDASNERAADGARPCDPSEAAPSSQAAAPEGDAAPSCAEGSSAADGAVAQGDGRTASGAPDGAADASAAEEGAERSEGAPSHRSRRRRGGRRHRRKSAEGAQTPEAPAADAHEADDRAVDGRETGGRSALSQAGDGAVERERTGGPAAGADVPCERPDADASDPAVADACVEAAAEERGDAGQEPAAAAAETATEPADGPKAPASADGAAELRPDDAAACDDATPAVEDGADLASDAAGLSPCDGAEPATMADAAVCDDGAADDGDDDDFPLPTDVPADEEAFTPEVVDVVPEAGCDPAVQDADGRDGDFDLRRAQRCEALPAASQDAAADEGTGAPAAAEAAFAGLEEDAAADDTAGASNADEADATAVRSEEDAPDAAAEGPDSQAACRRKDADEAGAAVPTEDARDWDALRGAFLDELDRFLAGFGDADAEGGDAASRARGRRVKAVYRALRPFHTCEDAVAVFDTALAGLRRLNRFAESFDGKVPGVAVGVLSQVNFLLKQACERLAAQDDVARACAAELLEEEAALPAYRRLRYAGKLRACARIVQGADAPHGRADAASASCADRPEAAVGQPAGQEAEAPSADGAETQRDGSGSADVDEPPSQADGSAVADQDGAQDSNGGASASDGRTASPRPRRRRRPGKRERARRARQAAFGTQAADGPAPSPREP